MAGAGAVNGSLIGSLPDRVRKLGPVCCVSYRVASRIANTLGGGFAVRSARELNTALVVLFHAPPDQVESLLAILHSPDVDWKGRSLVVCDCEIDECSVARLRGAGASVAKARRFELPGYLVVNGKGTALAAANRIARELKLRPIEVGEATEHAFDAAVTLGTCALTPLLDSAATLLREAGVRELDAPRLAAALFQKTAREYAHSGKQSWGWYTRSPEAKQLEGEIAGAGRDVGAVLRQLMLLGMDVFGKHLDVAEVLRGTGRAEP